MQASYPLVREVPEVADQEIRTKNLKSNLETFSSLFKHLFFEHSTSVLLMADFYPPPPQPLGLEGDLSPDFPQGFFDTWNRAEDEGQDDDVERVILKQTEVFSISLNIGTLPIFQTAVQYVVFNMH